MSTILLSGVEKTPVELEAINVNSYPDLLPTEAELGVKLSEEVVAAESLQQAIWDKIRPVCTSRIKGS